MRRPLIYVAGPYTTNNQLGILKNIKTGIDVCVELINMGFAPYCPWLDYQYVISHGVDGKVLFDVSVEYLLVSECMYLVEGWEESTGVKKEIIIAGLIPIPIFNTMIDCKNFLRKLEDRI
jgi:hypothetical protein